MEKIAEELQQRVTVVESALVSIEETLGKHDHQFTTILAKLESMGPRSGESIASEEDPIAWLAQAEQYFLVYHTPMNDRVQLALITMTGRSMFWAQWVLRRSTAITWAQFTRELVEHFGDSSAVNAYEAMHLTRQTGSLEDYLTLFEEQVAQLPVLSPEQYLGCNSGSAVTYSFAQVGGGATAEIQFFFQALLAPDFHFSESLNTGECADSNRSHNPFPLLILGVCTASPLHKCTAKYLTVILDAEEEISAEKERLDQEISPEGCGNTPSHPEQDVAPAKWFLSILDREGWLMDDNVDVLINLLIFKLNRDIDRFIGGWTAMEILPTSILQQPNFHQVLDPVMGYARRSYHRQGAMSWLRTSRVIGIANVRTNHWVCYEISFEAQKITVYDSMCKRRGRMKKVDESILNMAKAIPWVYQHVDLWTQKKMTSVLRDVWDVEVSDKAPQQGNGSDCGIMSLKFMECFISGHDVSVIHPDCCGIFRNIYCSPII
ncbi:hypothetical protein C2S52_018715 [Perilla frutescens var. hirtella]|nr:hypothetical protein C2S52_018715 [Perilla frutescens var. hirtella]